MKFWLLTSVLNVDDCWWIIADNPVNSQKLTRTKLDGLWRTFVLNFISPSVFSYHVTFFSECTMNISLLYSPLLFFFFWKASMAAPMIAVLSIVYIDQCDNENILESSFVNSRTKCHIRIFCFGRTFGTCSKSSAKTNNPNESFRRIKIIRQRRHFTSWNFDAL